MLPDSPTDNPTDSRSVSPTDDPAHGRPGALVSLAVDLGGRRALVTGAGQGVGEAVVRMLAVAGAEVVVNDLVEDRAEAVAAGVRADGGRAVAAPFDVTDHAAVHEALRGVGAVDILVNNAGNAGAEGFGTPTPFLDSTPADWEKYVAVNLYGVMNCVQAALPSMVDRQWGRIVTVISDAARAGESRLAAYGAAKAGAAGFCRGIAHEVARHGITVNNVALGTMRTPVSAPLWDDPSRADQQKVILSGYLIRRPGEPDDAAWVVTTLVSPRAGWITGQTVPVNGGYSFAL